jgi:2-(1,2-epoxy-1,2-dihydrophenyl)acetyl-CoA isomerase
LKKPVVAAVNGVAAGAGASLALVCDVIVASENASFVQAFTSIGLIPDSGATLALPNLIGFGRASATMLLGDRMAAHEAQQAGLVYKVYPAATFADDALALAETLAKRPTRALALVKEALNASVFANLEAQLTTELHLQLAASETDDFREGVAAFLEKRTPEFLGK